MSPIGTAATAGAVSGERERRGQAAGEGGDGVGAVGDAVDEVEVEAGVARRRGAGEGAERGEVERGAVDGELGGRVLAERVRGRGRLDAERRRELLFERAHQRDHRRIVRSAAGGGRHEHVDPEPCAAAAHAVELDLDRARVGAGAADDEAPRAGRGRGLAVAVGDERDRDLGVERDPGGAGADGGAFGGVDDLEAVDPVGRAAGLDEHGVEVGGEVEVDHRAGRVRAEREVDEPARAEVGRGVGVRRGVGGRVGRGVGRGVGFGVAAGVGVGGCVELGVGVRVGPGIGQRRIERRRVDRPRAAVVVAADEPGERDQGKRRGRRPRTARAAGWTSGAGGVQMGAIRRTVGALALDTTPGGGTHEAHPHRRRAGRDPDRRARRLVHVHAADAELRAHLHAGLPPEVAARGDGTRRVARTAANPASANPAAAAGAAAPAGDAPPPRVTRPP
ncbi:MAG: hypothetical protein H6705_12165 [Myxococcales bacterium]|nr:hypothetical protein [Myxococcales bacterium]